ncbi:hypothetical protein C8K30_1011029 [Promicromonospora sp. AC04]|uniref:hypothetical protein n=1 Tax=Promicromonospora sp. AC04 TaxID=2135723 RepID=UPI000D3CFF98|nr:hypothetical protein [Promicromonospora sp. AC04]PUB32503.1 hypothetical protein C8K30_1011029 [Promicromonospora sp. AC04]
MTTYSVSASQLTEGTAVFVRGKLAFARLARLIEGKELAASDQRRVNNGMNPVGKPHTTATITEAEVQLADPGHPTLAEQFVAERCYTSKRNPDSGANYSIDSRGSSLPMIVIPSDKDDGTYDQDTSGQELAQGLDVTLVLRVYKPKNFSNRGLALDQVIVHEQPRYYNVGVDANELRARGIVLNSPLRAVQASEARPATDAQHESIGSEIEDGLSFPAPQPAAGPAADPWQVPVQKAVVDPAAPTAPEETIEEKLARLQAENERLKDAGSAVGAGPWGNAGQAPQAGITYEG